MSDITSGPTFWAKTKKALVGGIAGAITAASTSVVAALADSAFSEAELWGTAGFLLGGFVVSFAAIYAAPKNAE